jgi:purine-cytosine permease-like protein
VLVQAVVWVYIGVYLLKGWNAVLDDALPLILYLFIPWTSINLADYFFVRRGFYAINELDRPNGLYGNWAWRGAVTYIVGLASMIPFVKLSFYKGAVATALHGVDIAFLPGIIVSAVLYYILSRSQDLTRDKAAAQASYEELRKEGLITGPIDASSPL